MKLIAKIVGGVLLAALIAWAIYDPTEFRHKLLGYSKEEQKQAWDEVSETHERVMQDLEQQRIQSNKEYARLKFGEAAASQYELCENYPPTAKANQIKCQKLMDRIKHAQAQEPTW